MAIRDARTDSFTEFASAASPRLRHALTCVLGVEAGKDAASEALAHGWENWDRVAAMENPVGYLYVVGRNRGRRSRKNRVLFPEAPADRTPWVEPALPSSLQALPERQRQAVMLIHGYGWTQMEVAELLGVSKTTVQQHLERGVVKLRKSLGIDL